MEICKGFFIGPEGRNMVAKIESGLNWKILHPSKSGLETKTFCVNDELGINVPIEDHGQELKIPALTIPTPSNPVGEGLYVSQLKDEEGLEPQIFINLKETGSITLFNDNETNRLKITNQKT